MANRLYNKQVSPKGYKVGGRVAKMGGGMMMKKNSRVGLSNGGDVKKKKGKDLSNMKVGDTFHPIVQNVMKKEIVKNFSSKGKSGASTGDLKKEHKKIKEKAFDRGLRPTEIAKMDKEFNARLKRATKDARFVLKNRSGMRSYRKKQQKAKAIDTGSEN